MEGSSSSSSSSAMLFRLSSFLMTQQEDSLLSPPLFDNLIPSSFNNNSLLVLLTSITIILLLIIIIKQLHSHHTRQPFHPKHNLPPSRAFTAEAVMGMGRKVWRVADSFAGSILEESRKNSGADAGTGGYRKDALELFKWVIIDVFGVVALGYDFQCTKSLKLAPLAQSFDYSIDDVQERTLASEMCNPFMQCYWLPTERNRRYAFHNGRVRGHMQLRTFSSSLASRGDDLLTILLKTPSPNNNQGNDNVDVMSTKEVIEMLLTLFYAGYDTSSTALSCAMYLLSTHKEIQTICANEARAASISLQQDPSTWNEQLAYCKAVVMESLRLHSPVTLTSRTLETNVQLDECTSVPKGTRVYIPIELIQTSECNFARATEFLPERWDSSYIPPANPHNIFAFSDGARNCVGRRLALMESTMVLACMVRDLVVNVPEGFKLEMKKKFVMTTPEEVPLIFTERCRDGRV
ncbi:hypothetical protein THAPSDRAFT_269400 [Thalassiosira pseudonana CCMP1335]|uniref:Cytochrome P450 n=1 Tax=Thalassiosira pseudonana TaxID=35128 RepID=B8C7Q9_THAPS|nr:hypothetical protein THAPSDRAFT_269400 [Thalassiosira pseudonana CCMP1335]EED90147.1 hypothetical protein THAPSDRAFT_269400 [Thalassiosira pseudonana CCMP1335]